MPKQHRPCGCPQCNGKLVSYSTYNRHLKTFPAVRINYQAPVPVDDHDLDIDGDIDDYLQAPVPVHVDDHDLDGNGDIDDYLQAPVPVDDHDLDIDGDLYFFFYEF